MISYFFRNISGNTGGFFVFIAKLYITDRLAFFLICPQCFGLSGSIVADYFIGSFQNPFCGAVVLLKTDDFRLWKYLFKVQNIHNIGTAEFVDGLVIIADNTQILVAGGEKAEQCKLSRVRILVLIHKEKAEAFLILAKNFRFFLKQFYGFHDEVIKIKRIILL